MTSPARMLAQEIGRRLRTLRQWRGLTQRALSRRVGPMDLSYVGKIERGEQLPSLKTLQRLATALGVRLGQFFEAASSAHPSPAKGGDGAERLWKMILRLRPGDLPLLEELIRVLVRHRQERARYARGGQPGAQAAEARRKYQRSRSRRQRPSGGASSGH